MTQLGRRWSVGRLLVVVLWLLGSLLQIQEAYAAGKKVSITGKLDAIQSRVVMAPGDNPQHEVTLTTFHRISWGGTSALRDLLAIVQVFLHFGSSAAPTI